MNNTFNAGSDVIDGQYISRYIWNVEHSEVINSNIKEVWEIISKERNLESFHPFCSRNVIERWGDHQSKDRIEYLNGLVYYREFCFWSENIGYDLFIKDLNLRRVIIVVHSVLQFILIFLTWAKRYSTQSRLHFT